MLELIHPSSMPFGRIDRAREVLLLHHHPCRKLALTLVLFFTLSCVVQDGILAQSTWEAPDRSSETTLVGDDEFALPLRFVPASPSGQAATSDRAIGSAASESTAVATVNYETVASSGSARDPNRTPISLPQLRGNSSSPNQASASKSLVTMLSGLSIVLGLLFGFVWFARRTGTIRAVKRTPPLVDILGSYRVSPKHEISVVRFGSKLIAMSMAGSTTQTLAVLEDPEEVAFLTELCGSADSGSIPSRLRQAIAEHVSANNRELAGYQQRYNQ